ncbi:MAG: family 10 glycosylhydrolase, partial [Bacteroidales bacterium]|nr:family 10 glycosylhydrolase [Bacteroidales bacterium]
MKKYLHSILALVLILGCVKDPEDNTDTPVVPPDPPEETEVVGKPRYVWIDASANFYYYANDKAFIAAEMGKVADCGFTDIVVDVRPTEGTVLWKSSIAPQAKRLAAWVGSSYKFVNRTATFDYLQAFIDAGHAAGLRVHAAINTFVGGYGGYYGLESEGPIFTGDIPSSWATVINASGGLKSSYYDGVQGTVFLNPANEDVQTYVLSLVKELAAYKPDGIILDRCRYDDTGLQSDFSDQSKAG